LDYTSKLILITPILYKIEPFLVIVRRDRQKQKAVEEVTRPQTKERRKPLEAGEVKNTYSPLETPEIKRTL
jgi:hypothetical protein